MSDPEVLCADEPTSDLDSFTAETVMEALAHLTRNSRHTTIICSIHQPRADVFAMFDSVLLLTRGGRTAYCGRTDGIVAYFSDMGFVCPSDSNPADYFVDLVSIDHRSTRSETNDKARVKRIEMEAVKRCMDNQTTRMESSTVPEHELLLFYYFLFKDVIKQLVLRDS